MPGVSQYNNLKTRFQLVVDYVKVMNYLHNSPVGAIIMCDTADMAKVLSQYLITDDFHLVVNDLDNTPLVADTDGILCSHKRAKESNSWFSPEQRGLSDSDSVPKTDEKIEIWRIPAVMEELLDGVEGSGFVKSKLDRWWQDIKPRTHSNDQQRTKSCRSYWEFSNSSHRIWDCRDSKRTGSRSLTNFLQPLFQIESWWPSFQTSFKSKLRWLDRIFHSDCPFNFEYKSQYTKT